METRSRVAGRPNHPRPQHTRRQVESFVGTMGNVELFEEALDSELSLKEIGELLDQNEQD